VIGRAPAAKAWGRHSEPRPSVSWARRSWPARCVRAAPSARPPDLDRRRHVPPGPCPRVKTDHSETAEHQTLILQPHVPTRTGWPPASRSTAQPVALATDIAAKLIVLVNVSIEVQPAEAATTTFRYPREAHPRSPERVAAHRAAVSHSPAAMVTAAAPAVHYCHDGGAGAEHKSEYVTYANAGTSQHRLMQKCGPRTSLRNVLKRPSA
jgi:hypothetical protein